MAEILDIEIKKIIPGRSDIFKDQGIPADVDIKENIAHLGDKAQRIFQQISNPRMLLKEIEKETFKNVFEGEGKNEHYNPVMEIYQNADKLSLFAVTMGETVSREIEELFKANDFPLGSMLDSVASLAAEKSVRLLENKFENQCKEKYANKEEHVALGYSPGYCGWHISGQKKLFEYLNPFEIGVKLNESYLMTPLKSVTGVLIYGHKNIHLFDAGYEFCSFCRDQTCIERMKKIQSRNLS